MSNRKADRVAHELLREIATGELDVGSILPKEADLAERFEVNRSVVREAIKLLEVHRLVNPVRRRGTEVLDPVASMSPEVLAVMLEPSPGQIDLDVLAELLELRELFDVQMMSLAAERRTDEDLARMDATLEEAAGVVAMPGAPGQGERYRELLDRLVLAFARATQNRLFVMLAHWHGRIRVDLDDVFASTRQPTEAHLQGTRFAVELVRARESAAVGELIESVHRAITPRIMAAAQLRSGQPLTFSFDGETR
jgi:DNA-binding FadR family transcriptional regulator